MSKTCGIRKKIFIILSGLLLIINQAAFCVDGITYAVDKGDSGAAEILEADAAGTDSPEPDAVKDAGTRTVLAFTSDIHNNTDSGDVAAKRLDLWLDKIEDKYGKIDVMSFCGDMGAAQANEEQFWTYTQHVMKVVDEEKEEDPEYDIDAVYTTGNHEFLNGKFDSTEVDDPEGTPYQTKSKLQR